MALFYLGSVSLIKFKMTRKRKHVSTLLKFLSHSLYSKGHEIGLTYFTSVLEHGALFGAKQHEEP